MNQQPTVDYPSSASLPPTDTPPSSSVSQTHGNVTNKLLAIIIFLLCIIAAGGVYMFITINTTASQQTPQAEIPQPQNPPVSLGSPTQETTTTSTVVTSYKNVTFRVGEENGVQVNARITIPDTWTSTEKSHKGTTDFESGFTFTTLTVTDNENNAKLVITNLMDPGGSMPQALETDAVWIRDFVKTYVPNTASNSYPHALYRTFNSKTNTYIYSTAEKGEYTNRDFEKANGWNYTPGFVDLSYHKKFQNMQVILPVLSYTGPVAQKEEILALFDKVLASLTVL